MKRVFALYVFFILYATGSYISAQDLYNINVNNGLPTNHVYHLMVDRHGYLWMATQKGVLRYNGYEMKLFDRSSGLPKEDIWRLYEDKKGRIWLSTISRQFGYISNNEYKPIVNLLGKTLYPREIREYKDGVYFFMKNEGVYIEKNDTLYFQQADKIYDGMHSRNDEEIYFERNDSMFSRRAQFSGTSVSFADEDFILPYTSQGQFKNSLIIGHHLLRPFLNTGDLQITDFKQKTSRRVHFSDIVGDSGAIHRFFTYNESYHANRGHLIVTHRALYDVDSTLRVSRDKTFDFLFKQSTINGTNVSLYIKDTLWNRILATYTSGIFLHAGKSGLKTLGQTVDLKGYEYVGKDWNKRSYWWHEQEKTLAYMDTLGAITYRKLNALREVECVTPYSPDSSLLGARNGFMWLDNNTSEVTSYWNGFRKVSTNKSFTTSLSYLGFEVLKSLELRGHRYLFNSDGVCRLVEANDQVFLDYFTRERFNDIIVDPYRQCLWMYENDYLEIYRDSSHHIKVPYEMLRKLGIKNIERIFIDEKYGNIFFKENDRLLMFHNNILNSTELFKGYVLKDAVVRLSDSILAVGGKFGIAYNVITGKGQLASVASYRNIKQIAYTHVTDMAIHNRQILLFTDKDVYEVLIEPLTEYKPQATRYRLLAYCNSTIMHLKANDTLALTSDNKRLQFDVINPTGTGAVEYHYLIKGVHDDWVKLNSNELQMPELSPGFYELLILLKDDTWKNRPLTLHVNILPYWWQKPFWKVLILSAAVILLLLFGVAVARVTRRIVVRNNQKKNLQMELELKAIYSQINPHFIYNSLNSALLLIHNQKTEEAYTHISKFSRLLRSYVKSSRNKYISINEEIVNIRHYIELQQTRFKDKFEYSIDVDKNVASTERNIPSLLLQPFVENAINHGLLSKEGKGNLIIKFEISKEGDLVCTIEDDGIGRKQAKLMNQSSEHQSFGNDMIRDLVSIFNRYENIKIEIKVTDKEFPLSGTIVEIRIKQEPS